MTIQRSGPTPSFYDYICNYALVPLHSAPSPQLKMLTGPGQQLNWIEIPRFQRGISWDVDNVKELLSSSSILLGTAILAQFPRNEKFPHMEDNQQNYMILIDGLQRFAFGNALLSILHDEVLCPTPTRPSDAVHFTSLSARVFPLSAFYIHNDLEFSHHPRQAVREQYLDLKLKLKDYIIKEFDAGNGSPLANEICPTFLSRQLALDIYFNFNNVEVLNTFIGINTVRVDLGPVDLLRAKVLEQATAHTWSESDIEDAENEFTAELTKNESPKQHFLPFISAAIKLIDDGHGHRIFPTWNTFQKNDVDIFLDFIQQFENSTSNNNYLTEIFNCGKLPVSIVFTYYLMDFLHGSKKKPSFFTSGTTNDEELHKFLVTCYRLLLDGTIGRTTDYLINILQGNHTFTMGDICDRISTNFIGLDLNSKLDPQWLETVLNQVDKKKSQRIFNAMRLPHKPNWGHDFLALKFGRSSTDFHIDHLIPHSKLVANTPGKLEGERLRNFAPLPANQNRVAKATDCHSKLLPTSGIYDVYLGSTTHHFHDYCNWLVNTHALTISNVDLNDQSKLEKNSSPNIGTIRILKICDELLPRL